MFEDEAVAEVGPVKEEFSLENIEVFSQRVEKARLAILKRVGDSISKVKEIQGVPDKSEVINGETWFFYGTSYVRFDKNGKVAHVYNTGDIKGLSIHRTPSSSVPQRLPSWITGERNSGEQHEGVQMID